MHFVQGPDSGLVNKVIRSSATSNPGTIDTRTLKSIKSDDDSTNSTRLNFSFVEINRRSMTLESLSVTSRTSCVNMESTPATSTGRAKLICSKPFSHTKQPLSWNKVFYQNAFAVATYVCNVASRVRARFWHRPRRNAWYSVQKW